MRPLHPGTDPGMSKHDESIPNANGPEGAAGDMGVSSERVGHAGPGQEATDGMRDTTPQERRPHDDDLPPEQSAGGVEDNPDGLVPKSGYARRDPRSKEHHAFEPRNVPGHRELADHERPERTDRGGGTERA